MTAYPTSAVTAVAASSALAASCCCCAIGYPRASSAAAVLWSSSLLVVWCAGGVIDVNIACYVALNYLWDNERALLESIAPRKCHLPYRPFAHDVASLSFCSAELSLFLRLKVKTNNVSYSRLNSDGLLCALLGEWCSRGTYVAGVHSDEYRTAPGGCRSRHCIKGLNQGCI